MKKEGRDAGAGAGWAQAVRLTGEPTLRQPRLLVMIMTARGLGMQWNVTAAWQWGLGLLGSWAVVWLAGPWLLDSILVRVPDPVLGIATLQPDRVVRWRSEGWSQTAIGPHGLPGWQPRSLSQRIILWGDSQVEGLCVDDPDKISNQVIALADRRALPPLDCLSLGRSGADAREWCAVMEPADELWQPALHVWVVTELSDLTVLSPAIAAQLPQRQVVPSPGWVKLAAALHGEALFAAAKRLLREPESGALRRLDFRVGPRTPTPQGQPAGQAEPPSNRGDQHAELADTIAAAISELEQRFSQRLVIVYAPGIPTLARPLVTAHPDDALFEQIRERLQAADVAVVDLREAFLRLWQTERRLPRGFHNGLPGAGHLNGDGNRLIAEAIVAVAQPRLARLAPTVAETASR